MTSPRRFTVVWTDVAHRDLEVIITYIAENDLNAAGRILREIRQKTESLGVLPERGRVVPELQTQGVLFYREIIHKPWRIIYRIESYSVFVLSVLDARRNVEDILLDRLIRTGDL